jgi:cell division protease FtsH
MSKTELEVVAYHESGHALMGLLLKESPEVSKLTIIPRSKGMLGFVKTANQEDKRLYSKGELLAQILILMAGRAAEEVVFKENKITTGASNDIEVLNNIARKLVTQYGMNSTIGLVYTDMNEKFQKQRTEDEISKLLHVSYELTKHIITQNRTLLDKLKNDVMKQKTLEKEYFQNLKLNQRYSDTTELINNFIAKKTSTTGRN